MRPRASGSQRATQPPESPLHDRIVALQRRLGVTPDGLVGPEFLSRVEDLLPAPRRMRSGPGAAAGAVVALMTASKVGLDAIVRFEVGSETAYESKYRKPIWPGGESGVTIGIGYDVGMNAAATVRADWNGILSDADIDLLITAAGIHGATAAALLGSLKGIEVPFWAARQVFGTRTLPRFSRATRTAFPGVEDLLADAQAALLSLVYNRGGSMSGPRRTEMRAIRALVPKRDLAGIAQQIRSMTRLWEGKGLPGLIKRRKEEAAMVDGANRQYAPDELVRI
jgi:hypothetical protein